MINLIKTGIICKRSERRHILESLVVPQQEQKLSESQDFERGKKKLKYKSIKRYKHTVDLYGPEKNHRLPQNFIGVYIYDERKKISRQCCFY